MKIAIFVEGQSELILTKEFLLAMHDYCDVRIECYALLCDVPKDVDYPFGAPDASNHYMIINVGNDNSVLSNMKNRINGLKKKGYDKVVGLRDMYSEAYLKKNNNQRTINPELIKLFMESSQEEINGMAYAERIKFCWAIMEVEAWFLGMKKLFESVNPILTPDYIKSQLGYDLEKSDPETTYCHPAKVVGEIMGLVGKQYRKREGEVKSLVSCLTKEHYEELMNSDVCSTFTSYAKELLEDTEVYQ